MNKDCFIAESDFGSFIGAMLGATKVIGPVAKKTKFVFRELSSPGELRLDYDVTILPAKKAFFPQRQELVRFQGNAVESCIDPEDQVLFGVHFYEVKAIDMLDELFRAGHEDRNYLANREHTTIVASSIQNVSGRAFFASVGTDVKPKGHDAFLTKVFGGYVYEVLTDKGARLTAHGAFEPVTPAQLDEAKRVNDAAMTRCEEKLSHGAKEIATRVRAAFRKEELWNELSEDCFSCGTCNVVCPTCYCFDVQDAWNLDQVSGLRCRSWDGCLMEDFAQVSLGMGAKENFREERATRYRHRVMRKMTYLNEKLGGPACVGCGRCSVGCVPDIADPVKIVDKIMSA
ncbi:MAG: 4Fe-4S dicluster domain-containing protein [Candidatus Riflebacteria bacterium]|nr:4Fe-4S dicluster domain-containing protein [Candidatus Riflebacteria bacterium]